MFLLFEEFKDITNISQGVFKIYHDKFKLKAFLLDIEKKFIDGISGKVNVNFSFDQYLPGIIKGDKRRMSYVIKRLLKNASLRQSDNGNITICVYMTDRIKEENIEE